jgi:hypothetical protein
MEVVMSTISRRICRTTALLLLAAPHAPALVVAAASPVTAESGWNDVAACATHTGSRARHACLDEVLRRAGLLSAEREQKEKRQSFGLDESVAATAPERPAGERVAATLAAVRETGDGKLILTTDDGAVWRQIESDRPQQTPRAGQRLEIRKASLGSFLCAVEQTLAFRCARSR